MKFNKFNITGGFANINEAAAPKSLPLAYCGELVKNHISPLASTAAFSGYIKEILEGVDSSYQLPKVISRLRNEFLDNINDMAAAILAESAKLPADTSNYYDKKNFALYEQDIDKYFIENDVRFKTNNYDDSGIYIYDIGRSIKEVVVGEVLLSDTMIMSNDPGFILKELDYRKMLAHPENTEASVYNLLKSSIKNVDIFGSNTAVNRYMTTYALKELVSMLLRLGTIQESSITIVDNYDNNTPHHDYMKMLMDILLTKSEPVLFSKFLAMVKSELFDTAFEDADEDEKDLIAISFSNIVYAMISYYGCIMITLLYQHANLTVFRSNLELYNKIRPEMMQSLAIK